MFDECLRGGCRAFDRVTYWCHCPDTLVLILKESILCCGMTLSVVVAEDVYICHYIIRVHVYMVRGCG